MRSPARLLAAPVLAAAALALAPALASAQAPAPFGHGCTAQNGVRFCPTTDGAAGRTVDGVPSFDGVPLDVDVTLPATGGGPWPTIVMLHGWGNDKTSFESTTPDGPGPEDWHYNNVYFAQHGYAVVNYTARGFGHSCGGGPSADHSGACANGYIRLADTRYEARDTQYLLGLLVDEGIARAGALGVTGISYGGGQSIELAYLRDRVRMPDGSLVPWKSPKGTPLSITAAWPRWPWSDLVSALIPNGRFLDSDPATDGLSRDPIGVPIQSYISGLFALGVASGYYCGGAVAAGVTPLCTNPDANLAFDYLEVSKGEPIDATEQGVADEIHADHQGFGLPVSSSGVAPLLIENGWTDDLFPPSQALRVYDELRTADPHAAVTLQFGDLGHSRGANKATVNHAFNAQGDAFFAARLEGSGSPPAPGSVTAYTQTCPGSAADGGPFSAPVWADLHPLSVSFGSAAPQTVDSAAALGDGPAFDPIAGTTNPCTTVSGSGGPGTATYTTTSHGFTMLGLPTVTATIATTGLFGQLDSRLYDVLPDGSERLVSRGAYRLLDNQSGTITFQLHGNGYYFAPGDAVRLELRGNDAPYLRPSNGAFSVQVSDVRVTLPVGGTALTLRVTPGHVRAGRRTRFAATVTTVVNGATVPVNGATVTIGGRHATTGGPGRAVFRATLRRAGRSVARASRAGFRSGAATVRVTGGRARHAPSHRRVRRTVRPRFTG